MTIRTVLVLALILTAAASGQTLSNGPDVIVGNIDGILAYGTANDKAAFAIGTVSCNIGNQVLPWLPNNNQHPVIAQNMYRYHDGRFDMIGISWLKHGFGTLNGMLCGNCPVPTNGVQLGVLCSDPYSASTNGLQTSLGPRAEVNATTGVFPYPFTSPTIDPVVGRRIQVDTSDLAPALNAGARYFVEGHYVTPDDAAAGNDLNNSAWREILISDNGASNYGAMMTGTTATAEVGLHAWQSVDPGVDIVSVDVPNDGRFYVGYRVQLMPNGNFRWYFGVHNYNSHRSASSFTVDVPAGATVSALTFNDIDYHSGDGAVVGTDFDGTDWPAAVGPTSVSWTMASAGVNANAIRWSTMYSFSFETDLAPTGPFNAQIGLYRSGTPGSVNVTLTPAGVTTYDSGGGEVTLLGDGAVNPLRVRAFDFAGQPAAGVPVSFNVTEGSATLSTTNPVLTDSSGYATTTVASTASTGMVEVTATSATGGATFDFFVRGLQINLGLTADTIGVAVAETPAGSPVVSYMLALGNVLPQPIVTPFGDLWLDITNPTQAIVFCDGIGFFGFTSVAGYGCQGYPSLNNTYAGASLLSGFTLTFQALGYNPGYQGWWISNAVTQTF